MKNIKNLITVLLACFLFILVSCENGLPLKAEYSSDDNFIVGTFQLEDLVETQPKTVISEYTDIEKESSIGLTTNNQYRGYKRYKIHYTTIDGNESFVELSIRSEGSRDNIEFVEEEINSKLWNFKTIEDQLDFFTNGWHKGIWYNNAYISLTDEDVINESKIVESINGPAVFVDLRIPNSKFHGEETISIGSEYYYEYFKYIATGFHLQFLVEFDTF